MPSTPLLFVSSIFLRPSSASFSTSIYSSTSSISSHSLSRIKPCPGRRPSYLFACSVSSTASDASKTHVQSQGSLGALLNPPNSERYVFFGGKGGVGKTTTSCSTAVALAEKGFRVLLISTDPAHSVADALDAKLVPGKLTSIDIDPDSGGALDAVECDPSEAVAEFRELIASIAPSKDDVEDNNNNGKNSAWKSIADKVKIADFADVLDTIPPGADELIALVRVLDLAGPDGEKKYDRIIIDTAPTGHTLRLLAFPDFLEKFLEKALALRTRIEGARGMLSGIANVFMATTGSKIDRDMVTKSVEEAVKRVEVYRQKMLDLSDLFRDPSRAEFVVVSIATDMAVAESERLIEKLWNEGVWCRHVVVNQILPSDNNNGTKNTMLEPYLKRMRMSQASHLAFATEQLADVYNLSVSTVPLFDTEVRGVFALRALAAVAFTPARMQKYGNLFSTPADADESSSQLTTFESSQFAFVGGKGGVGKTSTSAALGVALAQSGQKTLVLSTDPAHSLSDAFDVQLDGIPQKIDTDLYGMEIDPAKALEEFQNLVGEFARDKEEEKGMGGEMARTFGLGDFASLLDNAPPGIDELVALTQVLELIKYGDFSKVIIDTAPTGHTLRLLAFPEFLDNLLGKLVKLKARLDSALSSLRNVFKSNSNSTIDMVDSAAEKVEKFRQNMAMLKSLIENNQRTQFVVVTIPTNLAMAESNRLLQSLKNDGVQVRNLLVNQVIPDRDAKAFIQRIADAQEGCIRRLKKSAAGDENGNRNIHIVRVPAYDVEVRGVYALRAMGGQLFREIEKEIEIEEE